MSTDTYQMSVQGLTIDIVRKDIKNLHLGVYPPAGRVRVAAPLRVNDEAVRLFTISKLTWIKRQQARFLGQERQSAREYVSGETHYYHGRRYRLNVIFHTGAPAVVIRNSRTLDLYVRAGSDTAARERVLLIWYRRQLKEDVAPLIAKWEAILGVSVAAWGIKQTKTKWGTCNAEAHRIWLNLELIKKSATCLEYVIVHELVHLRERHHNDRFVATMSTFMPLWQHHRAELNRAPRAHASWEY
jgi:predicted metal-dependent hydrolase